jgi:hypothetical protein
VKAGDLNQNETELQSSSGLDKVFPHVYLKSVIIFAIKKILKDIKGPQTVSTVTKSVYDWENYKDKSGLEDELATASKDGYIFDLSINVN